MLARALARLGRTLRPLFNPEAEWQRDRLETILQEQRRAAAAVQKRQADDGERIGAVEADVERVQKTLLGLRARVTRELQFSERVLKRVSERSVEIHEERVLDRLARMACGTQPILVGPWTGEVGFELIYWIPFVRWALGHAAIDPARVTVISRGGPQPWYDGLAARYLDVLDISDPQEFRARTAVNRKQRGLWGYDRELVRRAGRRLGGSHALVHPLMMYGLFMPYWRREAPLARVLEYARFRRYTPPPASLLPPGLPERFVAVRFYFSQGFPDTPGNRRFVADTVRRLALKDEVVLLHAGIGLDDHADFVGDGLQRIHVVDAGAAPRDNLALQTAVISRARAFVGTYGGFSYLAPLYGVDTVACYSERNFQVSHLHAALHAFAEVGGGTLIPLATSDVGLLQDLLGGEATAGQGR